MHRYRRTSCVLLLLLAFAMPAAAQTGRAPGTSLEKLASILWQRLSPPLGALWEKGRADIDPNGSPAPATQSTAPPDDTSEGRAHIDPNG